MKRGGNNISADTVKSPDGKDYRNIDLFVVCAANIINLAMAFLFTARILGSPAAERLFGVMVLVLGFTIGYIAYINRKNHRNRWEIYLLIPIFIFCIVELIFDYILRYATQFDFRHTIIVGPYLLFYYFSLWMLIGYSFRFEKKWGFITLATYFLNMFLSVYQAIAFETAG